MVHKSYLASSFIALLITFASASDSRTVGQFCQFNSECASACCSYHKCQDFNSCPILKQIERYENKNYCTLDSECSSGLCCFDQKCLPQMNCFLWIYLPLILAAVVGVLMSQIATIGLNYALKNQEKRVKSEIREPWDMRREVVKEIKVEARRISRMETMRSEKKMKEERQRAEREYRERLEADRRAYEEEQRQEREEMERVEREKREAEEAERKRVEEEQAELERLRQLAEMEKQFAEIQEREKLRMEEEAKKMEDIDNFLDGSRINVNQTGLGTNAFNPAEYLPQYQQQTDAIPQNAIDDLRSLGKASNNNQGYNTKAGGIMATNGNGFPGLTNKLQGFQLPTIMQNTKSPILVQQSQFMGGTKAGGATGFAPPQFNNQAFKDLDRQISGFSGLNAEEPNNFNFPQFDPNATKPKPFPQLNIPGQGSLDPQEQTKKISILNRNRR